MKTVHALLIAVIPALLVSLPVTSPAQVVLGSDVVVEAGKTVEKAVSIGGTVTIYGTVTDDAVSLGDNVIIEKSGRVKGNAVSIGGDVSLKDSSSVDGDAVSVGGLVNIAPAAVLGGKIVKPHMNFDNHFNFCDGFLRMLFFGPFSGALGMFGTALLLFFFIARVLFLLACAMLMYMVVPERVTVIAQSLRVSFGPAILYGFIALFLLPFFFLFQLISIIGIPLIPLTGLILFLLYLFGAAGVALWVGRLIPGAASRSGMVNVVLGVLVISLLRLIPGVGFLMGLVLVSVSFGIIIITRIGSRISSASA